MDDPGAEAAHAVLGLKSTLSLVSFLFGEPFSGYHVLCDILSEVYNSFVRQYSRDFKSTGPLPRLTLELLG